MPAEEAQVDFGDIGRRYDQEGKLRKAYIFNMRLSYSRMDYYEIVFDQKAETWIQCHINAFKYFGGVPKVIKLDNLKAAIVLANFYEPICSGLLSKMPWLAFVGSKWLELNDFINSVRLTLIDRQISLAQIK